MVGTENLQNRTLRTKRKEQINKNKKKRVCRFYIKKSLSIAERYADASLTLIFFKGVTTKEQKKNLGRPKEQANYSVLAHLLLLSLRSDGSAIVN